MLQQIHTEVQEDAPDHRKNAKSKREASRYVMIGEYSCSVGRALVENKINYSLTFPLTKWLINVKSVRSARAKYEKK